MANIYRNIGAVVKDTGGLWDHLDSQIAARPAAAPGGSLGLWDMVVTGSVGGVWDQLDRETVLLRREHLAANRGRLDLWHEAADETLILPKVGLLPVWDAVLVQSNADGGLDLDGTLMMLRQDVDSVWQRSSDETLMLSLPTESIFAQQVRARDLTTYLPRRRPGYALKKLTDARGETYWILKNLRTDAYLRLTAEQVFLWDQMDGETSVQDIAMAFMLEYGKLSIGGLIALLDQLQQKGFIEPLVDIYGAVDQSVAQRRADVWWRRIFRQFRHTELAIHGIDGWVTRSYQAGGKWLFSPLVKWAIWAILGIGAVAFAGLFLGVIERDLSFIAGAGTSAVVGLISLYVLQIITLFIHEWSHALATKHFGREVRRGGFILHLGMPAAFVDTTDIWMEPRGPRIMVSWAGPHSGFALGGLASLAILALPDGRIAGLLYQFACLTYLTSFMNLNPLLKLDGYYILMDWLEIPRLREKSLAFIGKPLRDKLRQRERFSRDEIIFAVFGALSALWTAIAVSATLQIVGQYVVKATQTLPGQVALVVLVLLVIVWGRRRISWRGWGVR